MMDYSKVNGNVSDSGYTTNTGGNQSQRSNYALPQPISRQKQRKEKKSKTTTTTTNLRTSDDTNAGGKIDPNEQADVGSYNRGSSSDFDSVDKKSEEVAGLESVDATELGEHNGDSNSTDPEGAVGAITNPLDDTNSNTNGGFTAVISLHNGLVLDTTPSLKATLGYAREAWAGRSFIDFVHPKDKSTFADHLAKNLALPYGDCDPDKSGSQTSLFCNLRKHDDGRSSGSASDQSSSLNGSRSLFLPFHLIMSVKLFHACPKQELPRVMFLTVTANSVLPVYKAPEETIISSIFSTRHDPNCILTHVNHNAVQYLGYLPQDIIGRSLFDLYHPEDLPFIKEVYETVVKMKGAPFRSKPYRFAAQNGGYVVLETEWSSFVNPWREKIEFVVGHHRVLHGPPNPDVFQPADDCQRSLLANISEGVFKESKIIQGEIRALLDENIQAKDDIDAYDLSCRSKDLRTFVKKLLQEVKLPAPVSKDPALADDRSILEHGSLVLGVISPHHEYCDGKSSTETPPSYNQLNYIEKLERFFNSKPLVKSTSGSDEDNIKLASRQDNEQTRKTSTNMTRTKDTTPNDSGCGENLSSGSNNRTSFGSREDSENAQCETAMPPGSFVLPTLTESVLNKHNIDMEKLMAKQHKVRRSEIKNHKPLNDSKPEDVKLKDRTVKSNESNQDQRKKQCSGKRRSSRSQSRGGRKVSKYDETTRECEMLAEPENNTNNNNNNNTITPISVCDGTRPNVNIWPSASMTVSPQQTPHICTQDVRLEEASRYSLLSAMMPIYCLSVPRVPEEFVDPHPAWNQFSHTGPVQPNPYVSYVAAPLTGLIYTPMVCPAAPVTTMYRPFVPPGPPPIARETAQSSSVVNTQVDFSEVKNPESPATSVKAEPGSTMAMSESSKKVLWPGEHLSSCVIVDGGCSSLADVQTTANTKQETNSNNQLESSLEDSSDSSFYGDYLSCSGASNQEQELAEAPWKPTKNEHEQYEMLQKGWTRQDGVEMTPELIYQYQLTPKPLSDVLEADKKALQCLNQPRMINEQLSQLYSDMKLALPDVDSSDDNNSDGGGGSSKSPKNTSEHRDWRKSTKDSMMALIYEENSLLPSP